jgi:Spy/CpxP family protein refolding chaperone
LDLEQAQIAALVEILDDIKTERAQAEVDQRRSHKLMAEAFKAESFDPDKIKNATEQRVTSERRIQETIAAALERLFELLTPEQRAELAHLLRTGALSF